MTAGAQRTPSQVAETFFSALVATQWREAASMLDSASAEVFRGRELAILIAVRSQPIGQATSDSGGFIMAVASPDTLDSNALREVADSPLTLFADVRTIGALAALPSMEFAARYLEVSQRSLHALHAPADTDTVVGERRTYHVLGHVIEGDSLAHVLYRATAAEFTNEEPHAISVLHLRRRGDDWRLLVPADLSPLAYTFWLTKDGWPEAR
jgi:hypothetical protein